MKSRRHLRLWSGLEGNVKSSSALASAFAFCDVGCGSDAEHSAVQQPDEGEIGDDDCCGAFADVPEDPVVAEGVCE